MASKIKASGWLGKLKMRAATFVRSFTATDGELYQYSGERSASGLIIQPETVLQLDAAWSCVRLIAETIASLPLYLYLKTPKGMKVADSHPLHYALSESPNKDTSAVVFWEAVVAAMLLHGNAYIQKFELDGRVRSLKFLAPGRLVVQCDLQGNKRFYYRKDNGTQVEIPAAKVWHIPGFTLDGKDGVSVIRYGAEVFGSALAADRQANQTFRNGTMQNVYYQVDAFLTEDQRKQFKQNVQDSVETGKTPILEGSVDVKAIGLNPADAQLLESRAYGVETVCRWFRVPPSMVGHNGGQTAWGSGIESQMIGFLSYTLKPWLVRIEQAVNTGLLSDGDRVRYRAQFFLKDLLRADSAARGSLYSVFVNNGIMTRDEVREEEGLPLLGGNAAVLTVQSALVPLNVLGQPSDTPQESDPTQKALRALLGLNFGGSKGDS